MAPWKGEAIKVRKIFFEFIFNFLRFTKLKVDSSFLHYVEQVRRVKERGTVQYSTVQYSTVQ